MIISPPLVISEAEIETVLEDVQLIEQ